MLLSSGLRPRRAPKDTSEELHCRVGNKPREVVALVLADSAQAAESEGCPRLQGRALGPRARILDDRPKGVQSMAYVKATVRSAQLVEAARRVLVARRRSGHDLRGVAAEAEVPLGTLSYVFGSKEQLLKAVIQDVTEEIAELLRDSAETDKGLEQAIRVGIDTFWTRLVLDERWLQVMQYELVMYALRTPGLDDLAQVADRALLPDRGRLVPGGRRQRRRAVRGPVRLLGSGAGRQHRRAHPAVRRRPGRGPVAARPGHHHRDAGQSGGGSTRG